MIHRHYCILLSGLGLLLGCLRGSAATLDDIGVTALWAVTTNVNGAGLHVIQAEAGLDYSAAVLPWEIAPRNIGRPTNSYTYTTADGTTNVYPNSLGTNSWHAEGVGNQFYGFSGGIATNVARVDMIEANYYITSVVQNLIAVSNAVVVNQSFVDPDTNDQVLLDAIYDTYAAHYGTLFVSGAGNGGSVLSPSTCYNGLSVAAFATGAGSSIGPTPIGGRCKPDLTAPAGVTSFSTPQVSGIATLLQQAGLAGVGGADTNSAVDPRTLKALLLNGAVKPAGWTNGPATPLDARYGAGVVNALNAYTQLAGQKQGWITTNQVAVGAAHPPLGDPGTLASLVGWDFNTNTSSATGNGLDAINHYYFEVIHSPASPAFIATATLVWNRQENQTAINHLKLFLYDCANSNLVACSTSLVDNVQHFYQTGLPPGRYDLQVWKAGGTGLVSAAEPYALAFSFVPQPVLAFSGGTNLTWPVYPAGYLVEVRTNLLTASWHTNNQLLLNITNGGNRIALSGTNVPQFFRLRSPNW